MSLWEYKCHRYAFITYGNKSEAEAAKEAMNGQTVCGQEIKVDVAKPRGSTRPLLACEPSPLSS